MTRRSRDLPSRELRIGIDGRTLEPPRTGVGRYVYEICRGLDEVLPPDTRFYVYARRPVPLPIDSSRWCMRADPLAPLAHVPASIWLMARAATLARDDGVDVFWAAGTLAPGPLWRGPTVTTVYDLCYLVAPETMPAGLRLAYALTMRRDLRRAAANIAISHGTAARMRERLGAATDAIAAPAVSPAFRVPSPREIARVRSRYGLMRPYFLSVATREPRKNLSLLVTAYGGARQTDRSGATASHDLVLVGASGWGDVAIGTPDGVRDLGYVADGDLPGLYGGATAFVFPSRYEGYGIPVLEARRCGAPVIATDIPEIREAGGDAGVTYIEPELGALTNAIVDAARTAITTGARSSDEPSGDSGSADRDSNDAPPPVTPAAIWDVPSRVYADVLMRAAGRTP